MTKRKQARQREADADYLMHGDETDDFTDFPDDDGYESDDSADDYGME
jgi:hypothetical protein